jgi:hypothetical protein
MSPMTRARQSAPTTTSGPFMEWIAPDDLEVEPVAQRSFDDSWADKLAENWDDAKLGVLEVSKRGERYFITDGMHRRAALVKRGLGHVPIACTVFVHDNVADQAKRYVADNIEKRRPNPVDSFRIKVAAQDPQSMVIQGVFDEFGLVPKLGTSGNYIACISAVEWVYERGGAALLRRTLQLISDTFGNDRASRDGNLVRGVGLLLAKFDSELDQVSFAHKVAHDSTAARVMGTARAHKMATGKALYIQAAEVLLAIYNKGRTSKRLSF